MFDRLTSFKDNCGCGLMAHCNNVPTRQMTLDALEALSRMIHRGAIAADGKSGDGSGMLFSMPHLFMEKIAEINGFDLPEKYAVAMLFIKTDEHREAFNEVCKKNDLKVLFYRKVPVNVNVLGELALKVIPHITQAFVVPNSLMSTKRFEPLLYLTRKEAEHQFRNDQTFYIASFSDKMISYKGLIMPNLVKEFYIDLQDDDFEVSFALFHQRFSTNTLPRWPLAQPFRSLAHNGEINSIKGNRFNVKVNSENFKSDVFTEEEMKRLLPILEKGSSDSASVDNMFEFLLQNGVDFFKAARSMVPAPWQNAPYMDPKLRTFYEYTSGNFEAWDGPAALNLTDGRYVGCILDRNGLRPAKYIITTDNRIIISSEYGVIDIEDKDISDQGTLRSGQMIGVDLKYGKILKNQEINDYLKNANPYSKWLNDSSAYLMEHADKNFSDFSDCYPEDLVEKQRYHNYTNEVMESIIRPMIESGKEETGSMGDDTPLACFSSVQRNFTDFFRQKFAQVTNPPIDPIREKLVMSTSISFGPKVNILQDGSANAHKLKTMNPILSKEKLDVLKAFGDVGNPLYDANYKNETVYTCFKDDLKSSLHKKGEAVVEAVRDRQVNVILLDDRCLSKEEGLIPMPMMVGYINTLLLKKGLRSKVSIVAITGEVYDSHSCAVLLGYGVTALYPYLAYASAIQIISRKHKDEAVHYKNALKKVHGSINKGILKIMSKMGICTVESYLNSALFDVIGLSKEIVKECFDSSDVLIPGLSYYDIEYRVKKYHEQAFPKRKVKKLFPLEVGSFYKYMDKGEYHDFSPDVAHAVQKFARTGKEADYIEIKERINNRGLKMIRDFFEFKSDLEPVDINSVESVEDITWRFTSAAMSLGSISPEAHEAIAEAMNTIGGQSNSGEGGEDRARFNTIKNSKIKQVASGRFGVTPEYLRSAEEIQIKVAQGAKPGEGGQLPGSKVTPLIASLRCTIPGVTLISPPPHHDIYSIEDLAQLIFDLKQINPKARVCVKLVSTAGVGTIAVGVAKAYADKIIISGADGGTGAAQLGSIKFAGNPWELGLSEAHNALKVNQLRGMVELQTDGGLKTGKDIVKAAILGAETYAFGTVLLSTVGCKILRVCHLNKCSVGIATQDEMLRAYYTGTVKGIINYLRSVAQEVREILAELGYTKLNEVIGQTQLLNVINDESAKKFDFTEVLYQAPGDNYQKVKYNPPFDKNEYEQQILKKILPTIKNPQFPVVVNYNISNTNRSFGALTSGVIADYYGDKGLSKETITINLKGNAGQSLGAFLSQGMLLKLTGSANDYVGKGMRGGHIIIVPENINNNYNLAGNTCLYGATGGKLFVAGQVGERFGVRNSGALAVVEGTGDHPCEYMTGGTVVVLGETGHNFGAGMTGGVAFVYDKNNTFIDKMNQELIKAERIDTDEGDEGRHYLRKILRSYHFRTHSPLAKKILEHFRDELRYFYMVTSKDMKAPLNPIEGN
ncbi:glutamate synthase large subunit [Chondrinema litorale]|uniref:glutamate synthase large subunit n=1 Tax=Chondrinema litorale TaxID=2994555 RepID=UPI0025434841|nr:glutamate synthase large subunit [Chondrinema litorale]UZR92595.1 glutamate synthase large subunit [Chondrinema litorale]